MVLMSLFEGSNDNVKEVGGTIKWANHWFHVFIAETVSLGGRKQVVVLLYSLENMKILWNIGL